MFSMNSLNIKTRALILHLLVEGNSIRSAAQIADVSRNTADRLLRDIGSVCLDYQEEHMRDLPCERVQCDEIWSFVGAKEKNIPDEKKGIDVDDVWIWVALCADTKLAPCWHVGNRTMADARTFIGDLAGRLAKRVQLTTDGHRPYLEVVEHAFAGDLDFAQLVKLYGDDTNKKSPEKKYGSDHVCGARKVRVNGQPDEAHVSTSYIERQKLTMRMSMRRFTRLTNTFSKKVENHMHAISLHYMYYNFARIHKSLKGSSAMVAGITDHLWSLEEIAVLAPVEALKKRSPYKKRTQTNSN